MDYDDDKYFAAKEFWDEVLDLLQPREECAEEFEALENALEDKLTQCE